MPVFMGMAHISGALYKITTKGDDAPDDDPEIAIAFRPNTAQRLLLANLHERNTILKARQIGFCLDPSTRILTAQKRGKGHWQGAARPCSPNRTSPVARSRASACQARVAPQPSAVAAAP
jgi:hypothetical protein